MMEMKITEDWLEAGNDKEWPTRQGLFILEKRRLRKQFDKGKEKNLLTEVRRWIINGYTFPSYKN